MIFLAIFSFLFLAYLANEAVVGRPFIVSDFLDEDEISNSEEEEIIPLSHGNSKWFTTRKDFEYQK